MGLHAPAVRGVELRLGPIHRGKLGSRRTKSVDNARSISRACGLCLGIIPADRDPGTPITPRCTNGGRYEVAAATSGLPGDRERSGCQLTRSLIEVGGRDGVKRRPTMARISKPYSELLAEGMRFELTVGVNPLQRFSKPPPSATRPPLRRGSYPRTILAARPGHGVCEDIVGEASPQRQTGID